MRIPYGKYFLEIKEDGGVFHWLITNAETSELLVVGEQNTYQAALDEGGSHVRALP